ncbi:hypothetical protein D9756_011641 [Leucocoprinus leucothites]|uniref:Uncharacterized protein n=1 Tax=Leucocoprinus leucothites TaxID=201217 RepID=A0A8H5FMY0_9AGAR|nr:hypothetical protein D9756_011641 [Leucoagaricus leucothites]
MISKDLPLLWVVVGRPEPHLMHMFSRVDFPVICEKHQLLIDSDTREDVRLYLRDGFDEIGAKFLGVQGGLWPSAEDFEKVLKIADGLFALASAMMNYVGDVTYANPAKRLRDLMAFMEPADHLAIDNPLATLDLLYSRILAGIHHACADSEATPVSYPESSYVSDRFKISPISCA